MSHPPHESSLKFQPALLACGIGAAAWYGLINALVPFLWDDYSIASQTVSELSAIGAPTRTLWVALGAVYSLLLLAFAWGTWREAGPRRALRIAAAALAAQGVTSLYWPPMQLRGNEMALTDVLHIVWAMVTLALMLLAMVSGAMARARTFRLFTFGTLVVFFVFGSLTGIEGPRIAANEPTPWIGIWERINIAAYMLWMGVFAGALWRGPKTAPDSTPVVAPPA